MNTHQHTRHPFEAPRNYNYKALWDANFAWGVMALALALFALAIWAFFSVGWYQPQVEAPIDVPAVEGPGAPAVAPSAMAPVSATPAS